MNPSNEDLALNVKRGAYWLDENYPGWVNKIDLAQLQMDNCSQCIIGQAVGNYWNTIDQANGAYAAGGYDGQFSFDYGFDTGYATTINYDILEECWVEQVNARREFL